MQHENGLLSPDVFKAAAPFLQRLVHRGRQAYHLPLEGNPSFVSRFDAIVEPLRVMQPMR
jgi:hypothetical protein